MSNPSVDRERKSPPGFSMASDPFYGNPFAEDTLPGNPFAENLSASAPRNMGRIVVMTCSLSGLFAISNASMLKLMEVFSPQDWGAFWVYLSMGGMCAQLGLLTIWGAVGLGKAWQRQLVVLALGQFWIASWGAGQLLVRNSFSRVNVHDIYPLLGFPLLLLATQLPLWIFRIFGRWRIVDELVPLSSPPQMSIAGILGAMTFIGAALALARLGMQLAVRHDQSEWWIVLSLTCAASAAICLFVLVPTCTLTLRLGWKQGLVLTLLYLLAVALIAIIITYSFTGMRRGRPFGTAFAAIAMVFGFVMTLLLPLVLFRRAGYRLRWGRN